MTTQQSTNIRKRERDYEENDQVDRMFGPIVYDCEYLIVNSAINSSFPMTRMLSLIEHDFTDKMALDCVKIPTSACIWASVSSSCSRNDDVSPSV